MQEAPAKDGRMMEGVPFAPVPQGHVPCHCDAAMCMRDPNGLVVPLKRQPEWHLQ
jgi:hypothetical protein